MDPRNNKQNVFWGQFLEPGLNSNTAQDGEPGQQSKSAGAIFSPKMAQDRPKIAQDGPKMVPRWRKTAPRWAKMVQNGPKMAPR